MGKNEAHIECVVKIEEYSLIPGLGIEAARLLSSIVRYSMDVNIGIASFAVWSRGTKMVINLLYSFSLNILLNLSLISNTLQQQKTWSRSILKKSFVLQVLTWCRGKEDDNSTNGENIESTTLWKCHGLKKNLQINVCLLMNSYQGQWAICCCQVIQTSSLWRGPISDNVFPHACSGIEIVVLLNY